MCIYIRTYTVKKIRKRLTKKGIKRERRRERERIPRVIEKI